MTPPLIAGPAATVVRAGVAVVAEIRLAIAIVDCSLMGAGAGDAALRKLSRHYPLLPVMLVCIDDNGFRAHATFRTGQILALLQLEAIQFADIDLDRPPAPQSAPPF